MKKIYILLTICFAAIACKKNDIGFSYSPESPRAGQSVVFSNLSTTGEEWEWTFGDGSTSTLKSPTHTYKRPGTYRVLLKVDKKNSLTATKEVTVFDTVPTFSCADSTFYIYKDYTFVANTYNPYNYEVEYLWEWASFGEGVVVEDTTYTGPNLRLYFAIPSPGVAISLTTILHGDTTVTVKAIEVLDRATNSLLMRTEEGDYRQRIFGNRAEEDFMDFSATELLDAEEDTIQTYNGHTFTLSELAPIFDGIKGFHISSRKIYYRADGLWVANIDGAYPVQIDDAECTAMTLDTRDNRIYWANGEGVWYMPFVGSDNNRFVTIPTHLNTRQGVTRLAADTELKYFYQ